MGVMKFKNPILNILVYIGIVPIIYVVFGVFVVVKGRGIEEGIKEAKKIISNNGVVVMFPEGFTTDGVRVETFKKGAAALALSTSVSVLPVALRKDKRDIYINIGEILTLDSSHTLESATDLFQKKVSKLFEETFENTRLEKLIVPPPEEKELREDLVTTEEKSL